MTTQNNWKTTLTATYEQLNDYLILHVPHLIGAVFLMIVGWAIAWVCSKLTLNIVNFASRIWQKAAKEVGATDINELKTSHAIVLSKTVFWVVILFFIAATTSSLGLNFFSSWLTALLGYVPQILAAVFIGIVGYLLGNIAKAMTESAAKMSSYDQGNTLASLVKYAIFFVSLVIAVEQLGLNVQFITTFIIVIAAVLLFGVALAFALGSRSFVANIVAAKQAKQHLRINEYLKFSHTEGILLAITSTMLLIETENGRVFLPAKVYLENSEGTAVITELSSTTNKPRV